jgi:hypothetical protein
LKRADFLLIATTAIVMVSSIPFQVLTCCGTIPGLGTALRLLVLSYAHHVVFQLSSTSYADTHSTLVFVICIIIATLLFFIPAFVIYVLTRRRSATLAMGLQMCWLAFFLFAEFVLFPAPEGP